MAKTLAERVREQRDFVVDLGETHPGLKVKLRRPAESEMLALRARDATEVVQAAAVDWEGFTEALLLGPEVGASDTLPFDAEAWSAWVADQAAVVGHCYAKLLEAVNAHLERVKAARGN